MIQSLSKKLSNINFVTYGSLNKPMLQVGTEWVCKTQNTNSCEVSTGSIIKNIYGRLFRYIVDMCNCTLIVSSLYLLDGYFIYISLQFQARGTRRMVDNLDLKVWEDDPPGGRQGLTSTSTGDSARSTHCHPIPSTRMRIECGRIEMQIIAYCQIYELN